MNHSRRHTLPTPWHTMYQAIFIYRANFSLFFRIGLQATGWFLVANLVFFLGPLLLIAYPFVSIALLSRFSTGPVWLVWLIFLGLLVGLPYLYVLTTAKGSLHKGFIGLVAYQMLTGQPESLPVNFRQIKPWMWRFWLLECSISAALGGIASLTNRLEGWWMLLGIAIQIFAAANFFIADIILAVERCNVSPALQKCQRLSKIDLLPISLVLIITASIVAPLYLLAFLPVIGVWMAEWQIPETALFAGKSVIHLLQALGVSAMLFTFVQVLTIPLWQLVKASLYRELCELRFSQS
jgi:hypothetical protein